MSFMVVGIWADYNAQKYNGRNNWPFSTTVSSALGTRHIAHTNAYVECREKNENVQCSQEIEMIWLLCEWFWKKSVFRTVHPNRTPIQHRIITLLLLLKENEQRLTSRQNKNEYFFFHIFPWF